MDFKNLNLENIKIDKETVAHLRFKKFGDSYLITNDFGKFDYLSKKELTQFLEGSLDEKSNLYKNLYEKGFLKRDLSEMDSLTNCLSCRKSSLLKGPGLHIVVTTLRCNHNCIYCQASSRNMDTDGFDMDKKTAKKVVDRIFETTSKGITIEFQGGEPMVNWEVVEFIVNYGRKKEKDSDKDLNFSLVSNLSLMTKDKFNFLIENGVAICTSLDGPEELHNSNRPYKDGNSYKETIKWVKEYKKVVKKANEDMPRSNALVTISKKSLKDPKKIVDEYIKQGFFAIHLRPLSYLGYSSGDTAKKNIGYSVDEFVEFWKEAVDYIIEKNKEGEFFYERGLRIRLIKILTDKDYGYTDLSSPCGAVRGQVLYNYDGNIYTCDEGRMIEDDSFKIGNIDEVSYEEMVKGETAQTMISASTLENQACDLCPYKPYCGVCPVKNYVHYGTLFPNIKKTEWCKLNTKMFNYIFKKLKDKDSRDVFNNWVS
jgi:His-Xaa-Ser system radical SAM maturase HxsB